MSTMFSTIFFQKLRQVEMRAVRGGIRTRSLVSLVVCSLVVFLAKIQILSQVNGGSLVLAQQLNNSSSLPGLSERANGLNSRYLSAASTNSLAAATVAAANAVPQGGGASSSYQQDSRNFNTHSHQQQQPQPSNQAGSTSNNQIQSNNIQAASNQQQPQQTGGGINPSPSQYSSGVQQAQQPIAVAASTPVMTTTLTFNPLTGQFVPTDLSTGSLVNGLSYPQVPYASGVFGGAGNFNVAQSGPNRQQPSRFTANSNNQLIPALSSSSNTNNLLNNLLQSQYNPYFNQILPISQQIQRQQQQQNLFTRRNGFGAAGSSVATSLPQRGQQSSAFVEDDSGFFQQQVASSGLGSNLYDQLSNPNGIGGVGGANNNNLDSLFVIPNLPSNSYFLNGGNGNLNTNQQLLTSTNGNYQQQAHLHNQHHQHIGHNQHQLPAFNEQQQGSSLSQSSSSVAPIAALPSAQSSSLGAFNGVVGGGNPEYRADQCVAADNRHGTCYQASECTHRGGTPMGKCGPNGYVCCLFDVTCGQYAAERFVYFRNPGYPNSFEQSRMCRVKIGKLDKGTCQFRLDMVRFDVAKPTNGNCSSDMLVVSGQNENYVIPKICGLNDGQHYYVGVDESSVITLHMMMTGYYRRSFDVLITQIPCRSDFAAPAHCLQYYMGTHGTIKSFNYDDDPNSAYNQQQTNYNSNDLLQQDGSAISLTGSPTAPYGINFNGANLQQRQHILPTSGQSSGPQRYQNIYQPDSQVFGGYPNDLDYTMCIKKESGFCSITYQLSRGESGLQPFAVGQSFFGAGNGNSSDNPFGGGAWNQQPVSTECRDDYLLIGGVRLCSGQSSYENNVNFSPYDSPVALQFAQNGSITGGQSVGSLNLQAQQLQAQHSHILQQLARIQQQQAAANAAGGNVTYASGQINGNNNSASQNLNGQQIGQNINGNLEQQQAALVQQSLLLQQQLSLLAAAASAGNNRYNLNNLPDRQQYGGIDGFPSSIITDTTSGPFILRFVSNLARNARGFHIDYRQNPCK